MLHLEGNKFYTLKIAFIINGKIKNLKSIKSSITRTFENFSIGIFISVDEEHYMQLCKEALKDLHDHIILVGGDGTVNKGLNGIINYFKINKNKQPNDFDWAAIANIKIGVHPAGSGNDFIRSIYKDTSLYELKTLIERRSYRMIDVGWVSFQNFEYQTEIRFFINITDVGMGGEAVKRKEQMPNWMSPKFGYFWAITSTIATYKKCRLKIYNDQFSWEGKVINAVVANGKYFGNGLGIAPNALLNNGKFSLVIIGDITLLDYFRHLYKVKKCVKISHSKVTYCSFDTINIDSSTSREITIDMDGEFIGFAPMKVKCLSQKINIISKKIN